MMCESLITIPILSNSIAYLAQVIVKPNSDTVEDAALVFSGSQFFTALVAGLVVAFAFQLLFTNLGVAARISLLGGGSSSDSSSEDSGGLGGTTEKIGLALGFETIISVTLALFIACILAVKLSLFVSPLSGAIVGLVIWGTFFSLIMWLSSTTVGSLIGSGVNTATSGMQVIVGTVAATIGADTASKKTITTAEVAVASVRRELGAAIDPVTMRENVEDFLSSIKTPELNIEKIATDVERLLNGENLQEIADSESFRNIDHSTFVSLIGDRPDLSKKEVNRLAGKLEFVWQRVVNKIPRTPSSNPLQDFANYLTSATKARLLGEDLSQKLEGLIAEMQLCPKSHNIAMDRSMSIGFSGLIYLVMRRTDLSDLDVDSIIDKLESVKEDLGEQTIKLAPQVGVKERKPPNTIYRDIENYLLNAYPWQLKPNNLNREFCNLIYDSEADPETVVSQLQKIDRADLKHLLNQKKKLTKGQINSVANLLNSIRWKIIATAEAAYEQEIVIDLLLAAQEYLVSTPKEELSPEKIQLDFKPILEDFDATYEQLSNRLIQLDRSTLERMLELRGDMNEIAISAVVGELEMTRSLVLQQAQENFTQAKALAEIQWLRLQAYLRDLNKAELNYQGIKQELELLFDDPQAETRTIKTRLAQFDRDTLVQLLSQRQDLNEEQVEEIIDNVESLWSLTQSTSQHLENQAQAQYEQAKSAIADYLRSTGKAELNPEGIKQYLTLLLDNPQLGAKAIRQSLAAIDRDTLVQLLAQRDDLSQNEVSQVVDEVRLTLRTIAKAPRRLAIRTQEQVSDFQSSIAQYICNTDKEELNPQGIERDVEFLLNDPRAGIESLQERLFQFDRPTLVALLFQREDIAEANINQIVDRVLAVRDRIFKKLQRSQTKIQSIFERILAKIRDYLKSLESPELNYYSIKGDLQTLFDDPQAGFEVLRDRFSELDRNTLIAILSSRDDISQVDAERLVRQVERTRDRILQRAELIQQQAQLRLEEAKRQTQKQLEETRKAAASASWWLFFTALISAIASAAGGALGVMD